MDAEFLDVDEHNPQNIVYGRYTTHTLLKYKQYNLSGWQDLNLRPPVPKTGALPNCATPCL